MGWFAKFDVFDLFFPDVALIALEIEVDGAFEGVVVDGVCKDADNLHGEFGSLVADGVEDAEVGNFHRVLLFYKFKIVYEYVGVTFPCATAADTVDEVSVGFAR